jgi:hypothetical protein
MYPRCLLAALVLLCGAVPVLANDPDHSAPSTLEERMRALETRQAELYHTLAEKKEAGRAEKLTESLTISGLLEVEATATGIEYADGSSDAASDLTLATAQLGFGMKLNDALGGNLILLYEEDGALEVDEAAVDFTHGIWFARVGRHYLPFGAFHSHFVSDPLTLALGETRATAMQTGAGGGLLSLALFAFNGAADETGSEDHINDGGAALTLTPLAGLELGASVLSDLAESNAALLAAPYARRVGAWSSYLHLEHGPLSFEAEYLAATQAFAASDLDGNGDGAGDQPRTWNFEGAFRPSDTVELALRWEGSAEFASQPEEQYGGAISWSPWAQVALTIEYLRGTFDPAFNGGGKTRDLFSAQLAYAF